jgi:hypothetical protein
MYNTRMYFLEKAPLVGLARLIKISSRGPCLRCRSCEQESTDMLAPRHIQCRPVGRTQTEEGGTDMYQF